MTTLIAGAALVAIAHLGSGAGHPAGFDVTGAGAAIVLPPLGRPVPRPDQFAISGGVKGLYPGASLPLVLTITNLQSHPIVVASITTSALSPKTGCASTNLVVTPFTGQLTVPANGSAKLTVTASLSHASPDACQGVNFALHYSGAAVEQ